MEALIESNGDDKGANAHWGMRPDSVAGTTSIPIPSSSSAPLRASLSTPLDISSTSSSSVKRKSSVSVSIRSEVLNKSQDEPKPKVQSSAFLQTLWGPSMIHFMAGETLRRRGRLQRQQQWRLHLCLKI